MAVQPTIKSNQINKLLCKRNFYMHIKISAKEPSMMPEFWVCLVQNIWWNTFFAERISSILAHAFCENGAAKELFLAHQRRAKLKAKANQNKTQRNARLAKGGGCLGKTSLFCLLMT